MVIFLSPKSEHHLKNVTDAYVILCNLCHQRLQILNERKIHTMQKELFVFSYTQTRYQYELHKKDSMYTGPNTSNIKIKRGEASKVECSKKERTGGDATGMTTLNCFFLNICLQNQQHLPSTTSLTQEACTKKINHTQYFQEESKSSTMFGKEIISNIVLYKVSHNHVLLKVYCSVLSSTV